AQGQRCGTARRRRDAQGRLACHQRQRPDRIGALPGAPRGHLGGRVLQRRARGGRRDVTPPVDPNNVLMTGENSFVRLSHDGGKTPSDRFSHWRVLWCPAGTGHALFAQGELTGGQVRIYSDNLAVARWLQRTIETLLFNAFADTSQPVAAAEFGRAGDPRSAANALKSSVSIVRWSQRATA